MTLARMGVRIEAQPARPAPRQSRVAGCGPMPRPDRHFDERRTGRQTRRGGRTACGFMIGMPVETPGRDDDVAWADEPSDVVAQCAFRLSDLAIADMQT